MGNITNFPIKRCDGHNRGESRGPGKIIQLKMYQKHPQESLLIATGSNSALLKAMLHTLIESTLLDGEAEDYLDPGEPPIGAWINAKHEWWDSPECLYLLDELAGIMDHLAPHDDLTFGEHLIKERHFGFWHL